MSPKAGSAHYQLVVTEERKAVGWSRGEREDGRRIKDEMGGVEAELDRGGGKINKEGLKRKHRE